MIDELSAEVILGNFRKLLPILQVIPRKKAIIKRRFVSSNFGDLCISSHVKMTRIK